MSLCPGKVLRRILAVLCVGAPALALAADGELSLDLVRRDVPAVVLDTSPAWRPVLAINRVGFEPSWPRRAAIRAPTDPGPVAWSVRDADGSVVTTGALALVEQADRSWQGVFGLDTLQQTGVYALAVSAPGWTNDLVATVRISTSLRDELAASQLAFLRSMRCGDTCHIRLPHGGGYHEASDDYSTRVESAARVALALTAWLEERPMEPGGAEELARLAAWLVASLGTNRQAAAGMVAAPEAITVQPWADRTPRSWDSTSSVRRNALVAAALARAGRWLRDERNREAGLRTLTAGEQAYIEINRAIDDVDDGLFVAHAALYLHAATKDPLYLAEATKVVAPLLAGTGTLPGDPETRLVAAASLRLFAREAGPDAADPALAEESARSLLGAVDARNAGHTLALELAVARGDSAGVLDVVQGFFGWNAEGASWLVGHGDPASPATTSMAGTGPIRGAVLERAPGPGVEPAFRLRMAAAMLDALRALPAR